jgi:hypothetical protein
MRKLFLSGAALLAATLLAGCGGGSGIGAAVPGVGNLGPHFVTDIQVPNVNAGQAFSFDLGYVDQGLNTYYVTDRDNATVDKVTYSSSGNNVLVGFVGGNFGAGCRLANGTPTNCNTAVNANSGPNGLNGIPGTNFLYAGDVASVKVLNKTILTIAGVVKNIAAPSPVNNGPDLFRVDEGCFLPANANAAIGSAFGVMAFATPDESPPTYTFIRTDTQAVIGQVVLANSAGIEACQFDVLTGKMYYNDDGDTQAGGANPDGSLDSFLVNAAFTAALAASPVSAKNGLPFLTCTNVTGATGAGCAGTAAYLRVSGYTAFQQCDPAGLALNTTNNIDVAVSCRPTTVGTRGALLIINRNTGALVSNVLAGLADQTTYDAVTNRYYMASSRWTPTGASPNSCAATPANRVCTPVLNIVDATTFAIVARIPTGNNAHSVDVDGAAGFAFLPYSNSVTPAGCGNCANNNFVNGGISVFAIK